MSDLNHPDSAARIPGGLFLRAAMVLLLAGCASLSAAVTHGVLAYVNPKQVASFDTQHQVQSQRLNQNRDLFLFTAKDGRSDQQLLTELKTDRRASGATLNSVIVLSGQSSASVLNGQSSASVLNGQSSASVLNGESSILEQSSASVLNADVNFFGTRAPSEYVNQPLVAQVAAGLRAHQLATGKGIVVAEIDNGVDQFNPVLRNVLLQDGYNFFDNTTNWSAWADLGQSSASVLNGQSSASVLNGESTPVELEQSSASVLNGFWERLLRQSSASVLNGCSDAGPSAGLSASLPSVLTTLDQSSASVLNSAGRVRFTKLLLGLIEKILQCDPDFGHGTSVAGLIHLIAPEASILPIKAFGPGGTAEASVIYESLTFAIDHHADVINLSFSSTALDPHVQEALDEALGKGIIIVAAAGNSSTSLQAFPASLQDSFGAVVGVGAVDGCNAPPATAQDPTPACIANPQLTLASFSNFDPSGLIVDADVAAPGVQLLTTFPGFGLIWARSSGTSFSAPVVAGEAALLAELRQAGATNRAEMEDTADPSIPGDLHGELGHGLVQVLGALKTAPPPSHPGHAHGNE
ncbi:MAG: S8 family peptidase [Terriglobales bacterium]